MNYALLAESAPVKLGANVFRKQLLKFGKYINPNGGKTPLDITPALVDNLIRNFNDKVMDSVPVPDGHTEDTTKNKGYVIGLEKTADGMDALLEIKDDETAKNMSQGLIPAISAGFDDHYIVKTTGKDVGAVLRHAALVSHAYLKGMRGFQEVALGDNISAVVLTDYVKEEKPMTLDEYKAGLKKDHNIDVDALQASAGRATALADGIKKVLPTSVKLADDKDETLIAEVSKAVAVSGTNDTAVKELSDKLLTMEAEKATGVLLSDGKILPTQVAGYVELYKKDKTMFENITKNLAVTVKLGEQGKGGSELTDPKSVDDEVARYAAMK